MLKKAIEFIKTKEGQFLVLLTALVSFLRLYRFNDFVTYLGDQGRDAIVIKRILTFEHFPAIGAPTSVGQVYLGPFYYYFISPWLWLFRFEPIGLALGVAFLSIAFTVVSYFLVKDLFNQKVSFISIILISFSSVLIDFSRFSWNPNLLPYFTLFFIYFFIKALESKKTFYFILAGAFLSFSIQLHYLALILGLPSVVYFLIKLFEEKKYKEMLIGGFFSFLSFLFFSIPLVVFDLRHNFLNVKNFSSLFKGEGSGLSIKNVENLRVSFSYLNSYLFNSNFNQILLYALLLLVVLLFIFEVRRKNALRGLLLFFTLSLIGTSLYSGPKFPHYLGILYLPYIVIIAYLLSFLQNQIFGKVLLGLFLIGFVVLNNQSYYFFKNLGNFQIDKAKKIARTIFDNVDTNKYSVTSLPFQYSDATYRYFLEIWDKRPTEKDSLEKTNILYVVCEQECKPIGDPQWDIAYFAPKKVEKNWTVAGVRIYRLSH